MEKLSSLDVKRILSDVPTLIRDLNEKVASLSEKVAYYEKKNRVEKIAQQMESKNLNSHLTYDEKVQGLMNEVDGNLDSIERAVEMNPKQIEFGLLDKTASGMLDPNRTFAEELLS
jgi:RPA family protein